MWADLFRTYGPWLPLAAWVGIGIPLMKRQQRKRSREWAAHKRQWRELEIDIALKQGDEDYLRRKLIADLREVRAKRRGRELFEQMCREQGVDPYEFDGPLPWYWPMSLPWRKKTSNAPKR